MQPTRRSGYAKPRAQGARSLLVTFTGACLLLAGIVASTVFDDHKDSEDSYYLATAAVPFVIGLACLAAGVWALRGPARGSLVRLGC